MKAINEKIIGSTTRCIVCLKKATHYTGHLVKGNGKVLAGWCDEHRNTTLCDEQARTGHMYLMDRVGCFGAWHRSYGFKKER